jgi:hypothetical protein
MPLMKSLTKGRSVGLTDEAHMPPLSLYRAGKRNVVRGGKVAGIDEDDPIQVRRDAHRLGLRGILLVCWLTARLPWNACQLAIWDHLAPSTSNSSVGF